MVIAVGAIGTALLCLAARVYVSQLAYVAAILPAAVVISVLPNIWAHPAPHTVVDPLLLMFTTMTFIARDRRRRGPLRSSHVRTAT
jgi:hypothetical protein